MFVYYTGFFYRNLKRVFPIPILMYIVACTLMNPLFQHTCLYHAIILLIRFIYSYSLSLFVMKISKSIREMFDAYPLGNVEQINSYLKMDNIYIFFYVKILLKKAAHGSSSTISKEWCTFLVYTFNETLNTVKRRCWMLKVWV